MSSVQETPVVFSCDGDNLLGIAHVPQSASHAVGIVIVVGGPQYRVGSHRQFTLMARELAKAGYPVLRFDYRGMGDSGGAVRSFEAVDKDIAAAISQLMRVAPQVQRVVIWGLCDAASAALIYCKQSDPRVAGLVIANPWVRTVSGEATAYLKHYYLQRLLQKSFWKKIFGGAFDIRRSVSDLLATIKRSKQGRSDVNVQTLDSAAGHYIERMLEGLLTLQVPVLLLISQRDLTAAEFLQLCNDKSDWRSAINAKTTRCDLAGADHTFSTPGSLALVTQHCLQWLANAVKLPQ